jgi:outer membrane murein-binding lipoprotein Lpp
MNARRAWFAAVLLPAAATCSGCNSAAYLDTMEGELDTLRAEVRDLRRQNERLKAEAASLRQQVADLQALGPKRLEKLFHVTRIRLRSATGGIDLDDKDGDDAVKVYLQPLDRDGSPVKAAGDVRIQLFDLAAEPDGNLIGQYEWAVDDVAKRWSAFLGTYHYSFVCQWKAHRPKHKDVTVRVEFTDYLTGRTFEARESCQVYLPEP